MWRAGPPATSGVPEALPVVIPVPLRPTRYAASRNVWQRYAPVRWPSRDVHPDAAAPRSETCGRGRRPSLAIRRDPWAPVLQRRPATPTVRAVPPSAAGPLVILTGFLADIMGLLGRQRNHPCRAKPLSKYLCGGSM